MWKDLNKIHRINSKFLTTDYIQILLTLVSKHWSKVSLAQLRKEFYQVCISVNYENLYTKIVDLCKVNINYLSFPSSINAPNVTDRVILVARTAKCSGWWMNRSKQRTFARKTISPVFIWRTGWGRWSTHMTSWKKWYNWLQRFYINSIKITFPLIRRLSVLKIFAFYYESWASGMH